MKIVKVAVYCRVATADQLALETQKEALVRYATHLGYDQPVFYLDNGYSGLNIDRPDFLRLDADIQAGHIGAVIVCNIDRIGRNAFEVMTWINRLQKKGVKFFPMDLAFSAKSPLNLLDWNMDNKGERVL